MHCYVIVEELASCPEKAMHVVISNRLSQKQSKRIIVNSRRIPSLSATLEEEAEEQEELEKQITSSGSCQCSCNETLWLVIERQTNAPIHSRLDDHGVAAGGRGRDKLRDP